MTGQLELNARAELCRQLARREPANRTFWMAEAENWSRLWKERSGGAVEENISSGIFEVLRMTLLTGDEGDLQKREWPK
jgi:hypothetical protein